MGDTCDHYGAQNAVTFYDLEDKDYPCSWCGENAFVGLVKNERHELAFCVDCRETIKIIAGGGDDDEE